MKNKNPGTIYKVLSNISLVGLFLSVGILIVGIFQKNFLNANIILALAVMSIIFASCALSLVWVRNVERRRYFKTSIVFLVLTGACCILWIACAIVIYNLFKATGDISKAVNSVRFIRIGLVITLQFAFANVIARNIIRYKATYIAFQIIYYVSCLFVDFFFSALAYAVNFKKGESFPIGLNKGIRDMLFNSGMITCLVLFLIYIVMASTILKSVEKKKNGGRTKSGAFMSLFDDPEFEEDLQKAEEKEKTKENEENQKAEPVTNNSTDTPVVEIEKTGTSTTKRRLNKLQKLFDEKLITEEEYNKKRAEILEEL